MAAPLASYGQTRPHTVAADEGVFGNLTVDGTASISNLTIDNLTVNNIAIFNGPVTINNTLNVTGLTTLNTLTVNGVAIFNGPVTINNTLTVTGLTTLNALTVNGVATFNGPVTINNTLNVTGLTTLGNLVVNGTAIFNGLVTINNNLVVTGNITCNTLTVLTTASIPAITDVVTINGSMYPPAVASTAPRGAPVSIPNGDVWPTLVLPAGSNGHFQIVSASITGMASNAQVPGSATQNASDTAPIITDVGGPGATNLVEFLLSNETKFIYILGGNIVTAPNTQSTLMLFPGCTARIGRATSGSTTWYALTPSLRWANGPSSQNGGATSIFIPNITTVTTSMGPAPNLIGTKFDYELLGTAFNNLGQQNLVLTGRVLIRCQNDLGTPMTGIPTFSTYVPLGPAESNGWPTNVTNPNSINWSQPWGYMPDVQIDTAASAVYFDCGIGVIHADVPTAAAPFVSVRMNSTYQLVTTLINNWTIPNPNEFFNVSYTFRVAFTRYIYRAVF